MRNNEFIITYYYNEIMCNNEFIITHYYVLLQIDSVLLSQCWQVFMAEYGLDVSCSKKPGDAMRHHIMFEIVSRFVCSINPRLVVADIYEFAECHA